MLSRDQSLATSDVKRIAMGHVADLENRIRDLKAMVQVLRHLAENCQGDDRPQCPIIAGVRRGPVAGNRRSGSLSG